MNIELVEIMKSEILDDLGDNVLAARKYNHKAELNMYILAQLEIREATTLSQLIVTMNRCYKSDADSYLIHMILECEDGS